MRSRLMGSMLAAWLMVVTSIPVVAAERYEDAVGDATGDSPDIVAVTIGLPEGEPTIRIDIELAPERPFGTDDATWTDGVFVLMADVPDVDERGILAEGHYLTGTHGVTLPMQQQTGAFLVYGDEMHEGAVDVDADGPVLSFTLERERIGDPAELYFQILLGVERDGAEEGGEMEGDSYPEIGEPPAYFRIEASEP